MNEITMLTNADPLIRMALAEDITSEDISTNAVMREAKQGEVDLICKEDGIIAGLSVFKRVLRYWMRTRKLLFLSGWRCGKTRSENGRRARRHPCSPFRRKNGTKLFAAYERNCHLYQFDYKTACRF